MLLFIQIEYDRNLTTKFYQEFNSPENKSHLNIVYVNKYNILAVQEW